MIYFGFGPLFYKSDAPTGLVRSCASYSWGCAPRCGAPPQAIAPAAPPAPDSNVETPGTAIGRGFMGTKSGTLRTENPSAPYHVRWGYDPIYEKIYIETAVEKWQHCDCR